MSALANVELPLIYLRNLSELFESQEAASRVLSLLLAAIASVSLLVGGGSAS